ncbi:MAG: hypothetical protein AAF533_19740 [Acidobacteriota bacterium]
MSRRRLLIVTASVALLALVLGGWLLRDHWLPDSGPSKPQSWIRIQKLTLDGDQARDDGKGLINDDEEKLVEALSLYEEAWLVLTGDEYPDGEVRFDDPDWRSRRNDLIHKIKTTAKDAYGVLDLPEKYKKDFPGLGLPF